ncbi:MAG: glutamate-1-semialdehyde 2,1-aminomutase [Sphingobacteriales bacterium]
MMAKISPEGQVYQAGTLSGNPIAMAAGLAQLKECLKPGFYDKLEMKTAHFVQSIYDFIVERNLQVRIFHLASIFWISFSANDRITRADEISAKDMSRFGKFHRELLKRGVYFGPSGYEVGFISEAHTQKDLKIARDVICEALDKAFED